MTEQSLDFRGQVVLVTGGATGLGFAIANAFGKAGARVALNDVTTSDAAAYISTRLERLGVSKLLARAGATDGDVVWIGDFSFDYQE